MRGADPEITLGVEEEFFLVDAESCDLIADPDPAIFADCERAAGRHTVVREFLRSQIETNTRVCGSVAELGAALAETRRLVVRAAERHGAGALATSTHPFADWRRQAPTPRQRYQRFAVTYQQSVRAFLVGGMHIHVGFGDADERLQVMTALRRHLPLLHALSTSSPFSAGQDTGFKSFRLNLVGALPRTSVPPELRGFADYQSLVDDYRSLKFIEDGSELWWDIRPSARYPTIELRVCDICTRLEDAVSIAALFACLVRRLLRELRRGRRPAEPPTEIIAENRWLASRYGVLAFFGDTERGGRVDIDDQAAALVKTLAEDARALECESQLAGVARIIREGTSADRQLDHFRELLLEAASADEALRSVVRLALAETRQGID